MRPEEKCGNRAPDPWEHEVSAPCMYVQSRATEKGREATQHWAVGISGDSVYLEVSEHSSQERMSPLLHHVWEVHSNVSVGGAMQQRLGLAEGSD